MKLEINSRNFFSQTYVNEWIQVAKQCPYTKFVAYTKSFHLDFSKRPDNLIIYWSIVPDSPYEPEGLKAYLQCGPNDLFNCKEKCSKCLYCYEAKGSIKLRLKGRW